MYHYPRATVSGAARCIAMSYTKAMLEKKIRNIRFAINGIKVAWREEFSFKLEVFAALLVALLGWFFAISTIEWIIVVFMIGLVLSAEAFNTALEELCDKFQSDPDPHIAKIKDLAAAAVLLTSTTAFIVGAVVFLPKLLSLV